MIIWKNCSFLTNLHFHIIIILCSKNQTFSFPKRRIITSYLVIFDKLSLLSSIITQQFIITNVVVVATVFDVISSLIFQLLWNSKPQFLNTSLRRLLNVNRQSLLCPNLLLLNGVILSLQKSLSIWFFIIQLEN